MDVPAGSSAEVHVPASGKDAEAPDGAKPPRLRADRSDPPAGYDAGTAVV